ncbi:Probable serine/threonine-protein kinase PknJ [Mycobacteroides abscessus subsp. abscessus]|uniref:serine/threonine-protein kinase n=1 Tax=Mycobacteroides abscessus TaxID=36809 RepID=UPI00092CBE55|nr:serine/threonine-protein kinase [Mycobacteroides abscessus]MDM2349574.1 protein kinase [Mycobacteroides abscessus]MDM2361250.1 protein kinase [Mycobacteroides abscessus]QSN51788.1 protein kinase [Mycobacteroides abscessus subsp. abscessus]SHV66499.1 transmembrane serine/threonine-protein kinase PknQ [Mycobacteroides abscessus subsp. abscessus]SII52653.1 Probable serine/threonine-protein kinase PknJ [Mycobacteroides abscessus subsp. abscessus]
MTSSDRSSPGPGGQQPGDLPPGTVVSGYQIERVLGRGGMGTVYLAANPNLQRSEALKILSAQSSRDPEFRARFMREASLAASLDHPNIVTVHNRGETPEGDLWIAMQYVQGSDAHSESASGRMSLTRAVHIISEVAKALDYLHARGLVHRDVKPANILLSAGDRRIMLGDFGLTRALDDSNSVTSAGNVTATIAYAAPEILSGTAVDGRADVYALGCTLFRMLTGQPPFGSGNSLPAIINAHLSAPPPRISQLASVPESWDALIAKAMAKTPADRYQSAGELAMAAQQILTDPAQHRQTVTQPVPATTPAPIAAPEPVHAMAPLAMADTGQSMLKHKRIAAIIGVMVLVVASSVVAVLIWPRADEGTDPRTKASPSAAQVAPGASLAGQPNTVLDTLLPGQFDYPEGWEKNPSPTFRSGEFNPAVPPGSATNIGGTPVGCNTIDPAWALRAKRRETSTLYLRDRKKPEREIMIRVVPAADALSTDGASDALKRCDAVAYIIPGSSTTWRCSFEFDEPNPVQNGQKELTTTESCYMFPSGANSIRQHVSFNVVRGLLVYILASGASNRNDAAGSLSATALSFATTMKILRYGR